jgi:hypothetical protein
MIKLKFCQIGDVVSGVIAGMNFSLGTVLSHNHLYQAGYTLLGWNINNLSHVGVPAFAKPANNISGPASILSAYTHAYWLSSALTEVDVVVGMSTIPASSWKMATDYATNKIISDKVVASGMRCCITGCNDYNEYASPNQLDGVSFVCYSCKTSGRKMKAVS